MLEGKVAVVTGASRGIGKAIACKLASLGATVIINYNGSKDKAEEVKAEIENAQGKAAVYQCNISDYGKCESFIQKVIKTYGSIDILVNNAGITRDGLLMKMSEADFDQVIDTNLKGAFNTIRFASRQMLRQRSGRIQGRCNRPYQSGGQRTGFPWYYGKCHCAGIHCHGHDGSTSGQGKRGLRKPDPSWNIRKA